MSRAEEVASRMTDRLFAARRGHGSTEGIVERHLRRVELQEIIKAAYEIGWNDATAHASVGRGKK